MRQYRTELEKVENVEKIICNKCGKAAFVKNQDSGFYT